HDVELAIAPYLHRERGRAVPLRGHVPPHVGLHAGVDLALHHDRAGQLALRHARLRVAVLAERGDVVAAAERLSVDDPSEAVRRSRTELADVDPQAAALWGGRDPWHLVDPDVRSSIGQNSGQEVG